MKFRKYINATIPFILMVVIVALFFSCNNKDSEIFAEELPEKSIEMPLNNKIVISNEIAVESPPFSEDIFPCTFCHVEEDLMPNPQRRELVDMHDEITAIFDHDSENHWCLDCHDLSYEVIQCV